MPFRLHLARATALVVVASGLLAAGAGLAAATPPEAPGPPVGAGLQRAAGLRWSTPAALGDPRVVRYRIEADDGSGWDPVATTRGTGSLATGGGHTCALLDDASVKCWGNNGAGQLGLGDTLTRGDGPDEMGDNLPAVDLGTGRTAVAIDAGDSHTCALLDDGSVKCWGANAFGQLGLGDTAARGNEPDEMGDNLPAVSLGSGRTAVAISAGTNHTCALLDYGSIKCWGRNVFGQLGAGDTSDRGDEPGEMGNLNVAVPLGAGRNAVAVTAGVNHTCAVLDDASVKCWGRNLNGQLGLGDTSDRGDGPDETGDNLAAVDLGTGRTAVAVAASGHTCALLDNSSVKCWGRNVDGRLGLGDGADRGDAPGEMGDALPAVDLGTDRTAVTVDTGGAHTCALLDDASVKCWGKNVGQLGLGDTADRGDAPGEMADNLPAIDLGTDRTAGAIGTGANHTCALLDDASVKCWGLNFGQLGLGDITTRGDDPDELGDNLSGVDVGSERLAVPATAAVLRMPAGTYQFRIVALSATEESAPSTASASVTVRGVTEQMDAGGSHSCAVTADSRVRCWGRNHVGQLGDTTTTNRTTSVPVSGLIGATAVSAGGNHTCARFWYGGVRCWGLNSSGQLGDGSTTNQLAPVDVSGLLVNVLSVSTGGSHTCARMTNNTVKCWGSNASGQLGNNSTTDQLTPVTVPGLTGVTAISAGTNHTCARLTTGAVKCWGNNANGQIGDNSTTNQLVPVTVTGLSSGVEAVAAGGNHTCARLTTGAVKCWGHNVSGQLGNNSTANQLAPVTAFGLTGIRQIAAGGNHTLARIATSGSLRAWGLNTYGQVGDDTTTNRLIRVAVKGLS